MKLAVVSGLKATLGPALLTTLQRRPERRYWVTAAIAEMALDKVGILPSRSRLPGLIPRALSGAWVAHESLRSEGEEDPWAGPMGAVVAAGVATIVPMLRVSTNKVLGIPDAVIGLAEDYVALKLGSEATGLSLDEMSQAAKDSLEEMSCATRESLQDLKERLAPAAQSIGAGSM
jgi:hypothetical protein